MNIEQCGAEEIAASFGIPLDTLYGHARAGRIRGRKVGGAWRFDRADVQAFLHPAQVSDDFKPAVLPDLLRRAAAFRDSGVASGTAQASYFDLDLGSSLLADSLLSRGVVPGDRVLILLSSSLEFIASCFAVWKAGGIVVAEDPAIEDPELCHIMRDCSPEAIITDRAAAESLRVQRHSLDRVRAVYVNGNTFGLANLEDLRVDSLDTALANETEPTSLRFNSATADDIATITYASSRAKGVANSHNNWLSGAAFTAEHHGLTARDSLLLLTPAHRSAGFRQWLAQIAVGARLILAPDFKQPVKLLKNYGPTAMAVGSADLTTLPQQFAPALRHLAGGLRYVEFEFSPHDPDGSGALRRLLPRAKFHAAWNLTEAQAAYFEAGHGQEIGGRAAMPAGLRMQVVDEHGRRVLPGRSGWVHLAGPALMTGFWGQSDFAMRSVREEGYRLREKAVADQQGAISFAQPAAEKLEIRGCKIDLSEIETVLRRHIRVAECAVVGVGGVAGGFKLHAFIVPTAKGAMLTEPEMKGYCRTFLESAKIPARFHFEKSLPKSDHGEILRSHLQAAALGGLSIKSLLDRPVEWPGSSKNKSAPGH